MNSIASSPAAALLALAALTFTSCATSPEELRSQLRAAVQDAAALSEEITTWRGGVAADASPATITTIEGFKERAEELLDRITGFDDEVTAGTDFADLEHSLAALSEFDVGRIEEASSEARGALLDQFQRMAESVGRSAQRIAVDLA